MRTVCTTIDDFLENLRIELVNYYHEKNQRGGIQPPLLFPVHRKAIYLTKHEKPTGKDGDNTNRISVVLHVGAVVTTEEGEYLIECAEVMGIDYRDGEPELKGSENAALAVAKVQKFCNDNGLTIRPGAITY